MKKHGMGRRDGAKMQRHEVNCLKLQKSAKPTPTYFKYPLERQSHVPPLGVTRRTRWLPTSATRRLPDASNATPRGALNAAALPTPSAKPALVPAPPPAKVDTTATTKHTEKHEANQT